MLELLALTLAAVQIAPDPSPRGLPLGGSRVAARASSTRYGTFATGGRRNPVLRYFGGPVIVTPRIYLTFWHYDLGDPFGVAPYLRAFVAGVGGSDWLDVVTQYYDYGVTQGHITNPPHMLAGVWNDDAGPIQASPDPAHVDAEADRSAMHFGGPDPNGVYLVALPRHHDPPGFGRGGGCAYNDYSGSVALIALPYLPDAPNHGYACGAGSVNTPGTLDGVSIITGAEIGSALTDPRPLSASGWFDPLYGDISSLCQWFDLKNSKFSTGVFPTQPLYSDVSASCVQSFRHG